MPHSFADQLMLSCPQCGADFTPDIWLIIDTAERPDLLALIRNGSVLPPETAGSSMERAARTARTGARSRLVLSLGRLERYKGHQRVIAAMPAIRRMRPGARLRIAGRGDYEPELRQLVDDMGLGDVVTIGAVPHEDMPDTLAEAGVVALLSEYEAHPVAVMEALAARRRVVVADTTGFSELAEEGLVRAIPIDADPEVAAAAIVEEMDRPEPAEAPDLPSWDDTTDALEDLYLRVAAD